MKRLVCIVMTIVFCISLCACETKKEAKSESDARRILISSYSTLSEISTQLDDKDKVLQFDNMGSIKKRIDGCLTDIHSADFYKSLDTVSEKYEQAIKLHEKVLKKYNKKYTELKKKQDKIDKENKSNTTKKKTTTSKNSTSTKNSSVTKKKTTSSSLR